MQSGVDKPLLTRVGICVVPMPDKLRSVHMSRPEPMAGLKTTPAEDRMALHERQSTPPPPGIFRKPANCLVLKGFSTLLPSISHLSGRSFPALVLLRSEPGLRPTSGSAPRSWRRTRVGPRVSMVEDAVGKKALSKSGAVIPCAVGSCVMDLLESEALRRRTGKAFREGAVASQV